ncbi:unnamed protein product [Cylicocyclus nassatus]|uniref:Uncharacterized protein n=1 Tax=Cylicocyclus nassatus TaxID=53992 RepID=A0AA36DKI3_CYLNA|nr:unnamed protein product [Cylicocyclus nassatus]
MSQPSPRPSSWAKDAEEENRIEGIIRGAGCWEQHIAVVACKDGFDDWKECESQVEELRKCMQKNKIKSKQKIQKRRILLKRVSEQPGAGKNISQSWTVKQTLAIGGSAGARWKHSESVCRRIGQRSHHHTKRIDVRIPSQFTLFTIDILNSSCYLIYLENLAEIHDKGWFLAQSSTKSRTDDEKRELVYHKAAYHYHHNEFEDAVKEYKSLYNDFKHSRTHSVAVVDSLIRSALKVPSFPREELLRYLDEYEQTALDYGDQLQYLNAAKEVYGRIEGEEADRKFVDAVCLLCATVDLPEHWLAFESKKGLKMGPNFHLGYHVRALMLLERHLSQARGFVINALQIRLTRMKEKLTTLRYSPEQIREARLEMGLDLISNDERSDLSEELQRPAHDCRSKIGVYKTAEECTRILREFRRKFSWMFSDV